MSVRKKITYTWVVFALFFASYQSFIRFTHTDAHPPKYVFFLDPIDGPPSQAKISWDIEGGYFYSEVKKALNAPSMQKIAIGINILVLPKTLPQLKVDTHKKMATLISVDLEYEHYQKLLFPFLFYLLGIIILPAIVIFYSYYPIFTAVTKLALVVETAASHKNASITLLFIISLTLLLIAAILIMMLRQPF